MDGEKFHDRGYKALFSHPRMVEELIRSFVKEEFVNDIDFSSLSRSFNSFVTQEFRERETDIIWQVKVHGAPVYFYILIEFQSTVDRYMVLRMLSYLLLFYLELIKDEKVREAKHLPVVFPLMLYRGSEDWTAPQTIEELINPTPKVPLAFIPSFRYFKIAENECDKENLKRIDNIVSRLFLIELADVDEVGALVKEAFDVLRGEVDKELRRNFGLWLCKVLEKRKVHVDIDMETMTGQEVQAMLEANLERYEKEVLARGEMKGREEGRLEVAGNFKKLGIDIESIVKATGLAREVVEKL